MKCPTKLKRLYAQMSEHTRNECGKSCKSLSPHRCCSREYGEMAVQVAAEYGEPVPPDTGHKVCRFMGAAGCILEPHLRPLCTLHVCCINSLGFKPGDEAWTRKYFQIRNAIERAEEKMPVPNWADVPV